MQNDGSTSAIKQFFMSTLGRVTLAIGLIVIILVITVISITGSTVRDARVTFDVTPIDAKIQIDGKEYANGTYQIPSGSHDITVSHSGLETKTLHMDLKPDQDTTFTVFLKGPDNNFNFYIQKNNYSSYRKLAEIASKENNTTADQDTSAYDFIAKTEHVRSIFDQMPIRGYVYGATMARASTAGFVIRDGMNKEDCEKITCLLVNYYGEDYEDAVMQEIKNRGYDPADYQILYERYGQ